MNELKKYIETGTEKAGTQKELAKIIGIADANLRTAKSGIRGLPIEVCIQLANYLKEDELKVILASEMVTAKDEKKRKILESCMQKSKERISAMIVGGLVISMLTLSPLESAEAKVVENQDSMYIMLNRRCRERRKQFRRKADYITDLLYRFLFPFGSLRLAC